MQPDLRVITDIGGDDTLVVTFRNPITYNDPESEGEITTSGNMVCPIAIPMSRCVFTKDFVEKIFPMMAAEAKKAFKQARANDGRNPG